MDENKVRQIIKDELDKNYRSGAPQVAPHNHDGNNNWKIQQTDIINNVGVMGKLTLTHDGTYTLYFSAQNPSRLDFNGFAFDTGATDSSVMMVGMALLSPAFYFQPFSAGKVKEGGTKYPIGGVMAQCSSNLYVQDGVNPSNTWPRADQFYLFNAYTSASVPIATGQLQNLTETSVDLVLTNLKTGWNVAGNFIIT